jgi:hypothetical protein
MWRGRGKGKHAAGSAVLSLREKGCVISAGPRSFRLCRGFSAERGLVRIGLAWPYGGLDILSDLPTPGPFRKMWKLQRYSRPRP